MEANYSANAIEENMWAQCDNVANQFQLMEDNFRHKSDRIKSNISQWLHLIFTCFSLWFGYKLGINFHE